MLAAALATFLFSFSIIFGHRASKLIGGSEANFWRLAIGTTLLGTCSYIFGIGLGGPAMPLFFLSGIVGFGFGDLALYQALPRLGSRLTTIFMQCLTAPVAVLIEWLWLDTRLSPGQLGAMAVILSGVAVAVAPEKESTRTRTDLWIGGSFGLLAAIGSAFGGVISRKAYALSDATGESISGMNAAFQRVVGGLLVAGVALLIVRWKQHGYSTRPQDLPSADVAVKKWRALWPWVFGNALAGVTLGGTCQQWALHTTPAGIVFTIIALMPLTVMPLAVIFEGERITGRSVAGVVIAVTGVIVLMNTKP